MNKRFYILLFSIFMALSALLFIVGKSDSFTMNVLLIGNLVVFALSFMSYAIGSRYTTSESNSAFVRGIMGGTFLKFFLALIAGTIYVVLNKDDIKIADILGLMFIYIIYTVVETAFLAKSARVKE